MRSVRFERLGHRGLMFRSRRSTRRATVRGHLIVGGWIAGEQLRWPVGTPPRSVRAAVRRAESRAASLTVERLDIGEILEAATRSLVADEGGATDERDRHVFQVSFDPLRLNLTRFGGSSISV